MTSSCHIRNAVRLLRAGGIIAYPTEAVYGLGCDPLDRDAVRRLLALKQRPWQKGLIIVAADIEQLLPFLAPLDSGLEKKITTSWPGPVTWLLPASNNAPLWITGKHSTIAVRVSDHPVVRELCLQFAAPLVSTSANPSDLAPARTPLRVRRYFGEAIDYLIHAPLGGLDRPTEIRDAITDNTIRQS